VMGREVVIPVDCKHGVFWERKGQWEKWTPASAA